MTNWETALALEMQRARAKHGPCEWSRHEFYGVLLEEVDELWETIKKNEPNERLLAELIQVAAVCAEYYAKETMSIEFKNCTWSDG